MNRYDCTIYEPEIELLESDQFEKLLRDWIIETGYFSEFLENEDSIQDAISECFESEFYHSNISLSSDYYDGALYCTEVDCDADSEPIVNDIYKYVMPDYFCYEILNYDFDDALHELNWDVSAAYRDACIAYFMAYKMTDFIDHIKSDLRNEIETFVENKFDDRLDSYIADNEVPWEHNYMRI